jgi:hypothetical protein
MCNLFHRRTACANIATHQDVIFGSEGTAQADFERMAEINREIGLTAMLQGLGGSDSNQDIIYDEKKSKDEKIQVM